jgi:hypothetical protein
MQRHLSSYLGLGYWSQMLQPLESRWFLYHTGAMVTFVRLFEPDPANYTSFFVGSCHPPQPPLRFEAQFSSGFRSHQSSWDLHFPRLLFICSCQHQVPFSQCLPTFCLLELLFFKPIHISPQPGCISP